MNKATLKRFPATSSNYEFVAAVKKREKIKRKILVVSFYIPPDQKVAQTEEMLGMIADCIRKAKREHDHPIVVMAGNANNCQIKSATEDFMDIAALELGATRGSSSLDVCSTNINSCVHNIQNLALCKQKKGSTATTMLSCWGLSCCSGNHFTKRKITVRPITKKATEAFKTNLLWTDWSIIETSRVDLSIQRYTDYMNESVNQCFPTKEITV